MGQERDVAVDFDLTWKGRRGRDASAAQRPPQNHISCRGTGLFMWSPQGTLYFCSMTKPNSICCDEPKRNDMSSKTPIYLHQSQPSPTRPPGMLSRGCTPEWTRVLLDPYSEPSSPAGLVRHHDTAVRMRLGCGCECESGSRGSVAT